jgi:type VI secretion system secreted protein VgrG
MLTTIRTSVNIDGKRLMDTEFTHLSLVQKIGSHHHFEIRLFVNAARGMLAQNAQNWLGKPIRIGFGYEENLNIVSRMLPDSFKGIITSVSLTRQRGQAEYLIKGQSPTLLLDDGANMLSFEDKTLQEIVEQVFAPYSKINEKEVEPALFKASIPYIVQYKETNFNFVNRLAAAYGEWFYYDGLKLYFGQPKPNHPPTVLDCDSNELIHFDIQVQTLPTQFKVQGYDYTKHKPLNTIASLSVGDNALAQLAHKVSKQVFDAQVPSIQVQRAMDEAALKQFTERNERTRFSKLVVLTGSSRHPHLKVGMPIHLKDRALVEDYGQYHIIALSHDITQGGDYINHFEAIPIEILSPPSAHPTEPPFATPQLAEIKAVDDSEKLGRVRVKFGWQEGTSEISPWIRVASPYTGADKGIYFTPEVGDFVLVAFEQNNPEKPYVLTGMYHGSAKPEISHAKNDFKGIKTRGGNNILFGDKGGSETITMHSPQHIKLHAVTSVHISTDSGGTIDLSAANGTITLKSKTINVEATEVVNIKGANQVNIGSKAIDLNGSDTIHEASKAITINGTDSVSVGQKVIQISGSSMVDIGKADINIHGTQILEKAGKIQINGSELTKVEGAEVIIKGTPIHLNP